MFRAYRTAGTLSAAVWQKPFYIEKLVRNLFQFYVGFADTVLWMGQNDVQIVNSLLIN